MCEPVRARVRQRYFDDEACDPFCALQACLKGVQVVAISEIDTFASSTGNFNIPSQVMIVGKRASVCRYGKNRASALDISGARVLVTGFHSSSTKVDQDEFNWLCGASLGSQEQTRRYNSNVVNHRSREVLLLHLGATVFYALSCLSGLQTFRVPS